MTDEAEEGRVVKTGTLLLPHYRIDLVPGAGVLSELRGDCWIVRFVYDPVDYNKVEYVDNWRGGEVLDEPIRDADGLTTPPVIAAFGDPGEPREAVEQVFYEQVCLEWCALVSRRHREWSYELDEPELQHADVWRATGETMELSLLQMFHAAEERNSYPEYGPISGHRPPETHASRSGYSTLIRCWKDEAVKKASMAFAPDIFGGYRR